MAEKIKKSDYINISRSLIRKLYKLGCWGKGSLYEDRLKDGFPLEQKGMVLAIADSLEKSAKSINKADEINIFREIFSLIIK